MVSTFRFPFSHILGFIYDSFEVPPQIILTFWTLSIVQYSKKLKKTFRKLDVSVLRWGGGRTPSQFGPLERANLNHWFQFSKRCVL
jgi:hypothetical protein